MKNIKKLFFCLLFFLVILFYILNLIYPLDKSKLNLDNSYILYDINHQIVAQKLNLDENWLYETDEIPPILKNSVLHFEDRYFYYHFGINPFSIIRALFHNTTNSNKIGASTITMQVARMIEPKQRNYKNKIIEIFRALQLELNYSKDEILKMYFNNAPYGGNIVGVKAATYFYFNKNLNDLSLSEVALLSVIPKNPNQNRLDKNRNLNHLKNRVLKSLLDDKIIDESMYKRACDEKFKPKRYEALNKAYHYSNLAFKNRIKNSNLDLNLQIQVENLTQKAMINFTNFDVNNASVVVIDNQKMQVIAYLGSHDLKSKNGFNDGVLAKKSVGSTLKPFVYALALENGLATPKQNLIDTEIYISDYAPKNYTKSYFGEISTSDALNFSLNTPAVFLNSNLGENSLYEFLSKANLVNESKEFYGESLTLGSISLSLLDLTHLYTVFVNEGVLKPLEVAGRVIDKNVTLLRKESAYLVSKMLLESPRSYLNSVWQNTENMPLIAFKTGTSAKAIDLYTLAFNKNYTVGVWIGNFNSKPTNGLSGAESSAKIVFEIFRYLSQKTNFKFIEKPKEIKDKKICVDAFVYDKCKSFENDSLIDGVVLKDRCLLISNEQIHYLFINGFINQTDIRKSPCYDKFKEIKPHIAYPANKSKISTFDNQINIKCLSFLGDDIYLKINDQEYNKFKSGDEVKLNLQNGYNNIKCLDENSNLSESNIYIRSF